MGDRHQDLIDRIITATLKGQIRSKAQVSRLLQEGIEPGDGELFERCLQETLRRVAEQVETGDELRQAKALRQQRALATIEGEWQRWQQENQASGLLTQVVASLTQAAEDKSALMAALTNALDPNQPHSLSRDQVAQLAQALEQQAQQPGQGSLGDLAVGLRQGLRRWQELETQVVGWIYEQRQQLGFGGPAEPQGPWASWGKAVEAGSVQRLFEDLAQHQSITAAGLPAAMGTDTWLELTLVLQRLQQGLVAWFDKQPYDPKAGKRLSIGTFLTFAVVWSQLAERLRQLGQTALADGSFQMLLQVLRQFSLQDYFPLYGGLFAALSGEPLKTLLDYLDRPLQEVPNTQSKARILTLLGYSQRALGAHQRAIQFHQKALDIARAAKDQPCEIASLNHLSRTAVQQQEYDTAIDHSQRALILARQAGDRLGEANALANLGYSQVFKAQAESMEAEQYETVLLYLEQGLELSERLGDRPSQALCAHSLGVARQMLGRPAEAIDALEKGLPVAQAVGDVFLQGMTYAAMASAYQQLDNGAMAVFTGAMAMYLLHQIDSQRWQQPARLLSILYGQLGPERFQEILAEYRSGFLKQIGVDGYDYLPKLLAEFRESLEG